MRASQYGHAEVCELLLNRGADVNHEDKVCDMCYINNIIECIHYIYRISFYIL
jgi:hypothetical protein